MNETWNAFLQSQGGRYENGSLRDFGHPEAERRARRDGNLLVDLSTLALLRVAGPDARNFLNGQFTNDIHLVDASRSQLSAWCTAQGRMLAVLRVFQRDDGYLLQLPMELRDEFVKRLRMFVLRAKVTVDDLDQQLVRIGVVGPDAGRLLGDAAGDVPQENDQCLTHDGVIVVRLPGIHPRFEVIAPHAVATALWGKLRERATPAGFDAWVWHDIMAGIPTVLPPTREAFVPQMANLELIGGVNFKKGCYPGQEIVARMQYLGRLKQRMYRAHIAGEPPVPGTAIFAPGGEQSVGTVVDARLSPEEGSDLSAVIQIAAVEAGEVRLGSANGAILSVSPPPYSFELTQTQKAS
jgi:tRNA-modifying protein YgfZ